MQTGIGILAAMVLYAPAGRAQQPPTSIWQGTGANPYEYPNGYGFINADRIPEYRAKPPKKKKMFGSGVPWWLSHEAMASVGYS